MDRLVVAKIDTLRWVWLETKKFIWLHLGPESEPGEGKVKNQSCLECPEAHLGFGIFEIQCNFGNWENL